MLLRTRCAFPTVDCRQHRVCVMLTVVWGVCAHCPTCWKACASLSLCTHTLRCLRYGDFSPRTTAGRTLLIVFVLAFMGLFSVLVTEFSALRHKWLDGKLHKRVAQYRHISPDVQDAVVVTIVFSHAVCTGAAVLMLTEGWTFGDGVYFSCITLTTVSWMWSPRVVLLCTVACVLSVLPCRSFLHSAGIW